VDAWRRVVRHGRYVLFQLAEVAVSRAVVRRDPARIDGLRPLSPPLRALSIESHHRRQPPTADGCGTAEVMRRAGVSKPCVLIRSFYNV
jgi:hypothetical protein